MGGAELSRVLSGEKITPLHLLEHYFSCIAGAKCLLPSPNVKSPASFSYTVLLDPFVI